MFTDRTNGLAVEGDYDQGHGCDSVRNYFRTFSIKISVCDYQGNLRTVFLCYVEEAGRKLIRNSVTTYRSTRRHTQEGLTPLRSLQLTQIFSIYSLILSTVSLTLAEIYAKYFYSPIGDNFVVHVSNVTTCSAEMLSKDENQYGIL